MRRAVIVAAAALLSLGGALPAAAVPASGQPGTAQLVTVQMPGPGHQSEWSTTVRNPASSPSTVSLAVLDVTGGASAIDDALQVSVRVDGVTVIPQTPLRRLIGGDAVPLGTVAGGGVKTVSGDVVLSSAAGNEYQGLSAQFTLRLSSLEAAPAPPLADTGLTVIGVGVPLALIVAGVLLRLRRRKAGEQV
ncbi:hypothetical protein ACFQ9V_01325 [Leifsonia sp. NPDC056665]|uniref:hypothetical protein n=1 Tax=Leifsonia sp. NPDC056665 TaxID=3345901 RepID=UPI0036B06BB2